MKYRIILLAVTTLLMPRAFGRGLSRETAESVREKIISSWRERVRLQYADMMWSGDASKLQVSSSEATMPLWYAVYGNAPFGRRSLWISLHGGGGTTQEVNNQQWENQKRLYRPDEGVYVAPRAPWNAWNMWCKPEIDSLYERLIECMVCTQGVDPDRVFLMGYSAGGDGVWRMATRMTDHFAAASMMAGHPGIVGLRNLLNLPYMIWCGEQDHAYNRARLCAAKGRELDSLQRIEPAGYVHETHIVPGKGHWMDREDAAALRWMQRYTRNPYPKHVIWQQEEEVRQHFYWISVPPSERQKGRRVEVQIKDGNKVEITECDYSHLTLNLNDQLLDLDRRVKVFYHGRQIYSGRVQRSESCLRRTMEERRDPSFCFPAQLTVTIGN